MSKLNRRNFLKLLGASAAALALKRPTVFDMGREMAGWSERNRIYRPGILAGPGPVQCYFQWYYWEGVLRTKAILNGLQVPVTCVQKKVDRWGLNITRDLLGRVSGVFFEYPALSKLPYGGGIIRPARFT